ncbi:hypothetical protein CSOJ01_01340 [Colletotrichum sojae]|uniref:Uncharacterized protein n=1 Tax=Colletotrichum sojae TaxID=2175907 RepID=A0A8H6JUG6_9PEZI|nr:hypothetical protein CSOJ01_01340 [Colletotrichum sojae]
MLQDAVVVVGGEEEKPDKDPDTYMPYSVPAVVVHLVYHTDIVRSLPPDQSTSHSECDYRRPADTRSGQDVELSPSGSSSFRGPPQFRRVSLPHGAFLTTLSYSACALARAERNLVTRRKTVTTLHAREPVSEHALHHAKKKATTSPDCIQKTIHLLLAWHAAYVTRCDPLRSAQTEAMHGLRTAARDSRAAEHTEQEQHNLSTPRSRTGGPDPRARRHLCQYYALPSPSRRTDVRTVSDPACVWPGSLAVQRDVLQRSGTGSSEHLAAWVRRFRTAAIAH